jgi:hypothetical protein
MSKNSLRISTQVKVRKEYDVVLVAGRNASSTDSGMEILRGIPTCVMTGEASGIAAAIAVKDGLTAASMNIGKLQARLKLSGVMLPVNI